MRVCQVGSHNLYTPYLVNGLSNQFDSTAIMLKHPMQDITKYYNQNVDLIQINKKQIGDLLNLVPTIKKVEKAVDCFLFHYLNPYFASILSLNIINKPVAYFCYSGDIQKFGFRKWIVKMALKNIDIIFVESKTDKKYLVYEYNVPEKRICTVVWYPVDKIFKKNTCIKRDEIREQWGISKEFVIFSPRALTPVYNHHKLLEGIAKLRHTENIQVIFSGLNVNKDYQKKLKKIADTNNINTIFLDKILNPREMAELYTISLLNVNIPKYDGMARSIVEGTLCDSIPLLNNNIKVYNEFFKNKENCIFVEPTPVSIAEGINYVLDNPKIQEKFYKNNLDITNAYFNWNNNLEIVCNSVEKIIQEVKP